MIVVATTLHAYVTDQVDTSEAWLYNAEAIAESHPDGVRFFAALETDGRGLAPFGSLVDRMLTIGDRLSTPPEATDHRQVGADYWTFSFDDGATEITTANRLRRIVTGQNIATQYAIEVGASHMLFCAADCAPPPDVLPKLLELDHPLCGPEIPTYCLSGPEPLTDVEAEVHVRGRDEAVQIGGTPRYPDFPVQEHMASAACILIGREVFTKLRWQYDSIAGMTDDPCYHRDALEVLGIPTYVRKDCVARHYPDAIGAIETRGHDRRIVR